MVDSNAALLGHIAVHQKLITPEQLREALQLQLVGEAEGQPLPLGQILLNKGWVSQANLDELLGIQEAYLSRRAADAVDTRAAARPTAEPYDASAPSEKASPQEELRAILERAVALGAADIHIHGGSPLFLRKSGVLQTAGRTAVSPEAAERFLRAALSHEQAQTLETAGEADVVLDLGPTGRFRGNVFRHQGGLSGIFRHIAPNPPTLTSLNLPTDLARLMSYHQGLVLVTGPAGSGKSSTLAALVGVVNAERQDHVLSIEDPVEFVHSSQRCIVNQRQVERHTESFASALRGALREDPDVIVIGELRDLETVSLALTAAETGHLVLATLTTTSAIRTIERVIGMFPPQRQGQVRSMLSEALRAVICQRLVRRADGEGRVAALEVLVVTKAAGNLIREGKTFQLQSVMQTGATQGMRLLDNSLAELVAAGTVSAEEARRVAEDPSRFAQDEA